MNSGVDLELGVRWQDRRARYRDRRVFAAVDPSVARVAETPLGELLAGGVATTVLAHDPALRLMTARSDWPVSLGGQRIAPCPGRWFPRLVLAGRHGFASGDRAPMRVVAVDAENIAVDLNPPLAGVALEVEAIRLAAAMPSPQAATGAVDLLPQLLAGGPGMQAALADGSFLCPRDDDLGRGDEGPDAEFYAVPRFVDHLDAVALEQMRALHRRFLVPGMRVLDLMASGNSHLPDEVTDFGVCGLGMNAEELARNPRLERRVVHDLNEDPTLPFATAAFDLVLCALSVEYLVRPQAVFEEVARVLKPGSTLVVSFSERWFPPKAIRVWGELHPFERIGLVLDYFARSGKFADLHAESLRGLPRPPDDKYYRLTKVSDPIYAVWGKVPPAASKPSG